MTQKFNDQAPTLIVTALLLVGLALWVRHENTAANATLVKQLQDQNEALRSAVDDNRSRSEATAALLRNAIARDDGMVFRSDVEMEKLDLSG